LVHFLKTFSADLKLACNSAFFDTFFDLKKMAQKSKNILSKCIIDLNFAPIKGSVFLNFQKMSNSLYPNVEYGTGHNQGLFDQFVFE